MKALLAKLKPELFSLIITIWWGILFIYPDFLIYPTTGFLGTIYLFFHFGLICIPLFLIIYILSINKYVFLVTSPILTFLGSLIGYYSYAYKATLTPMILDAALNNDIGTSLDVISIELLTFVLLNLIAIFFFIRYRIKKNNFERSAWRFLIAICLFLAMIMVNGRVRDTFMQHFPLSVYYNFSEYHKLEVQKNTVRVSPEPNLHSKCNDSLIVVFVIGEALRADHLQINGYYRNTTPLLSQRKNLISLPNIYSEYTYTNRSLPHILTRADSVTPERAFQEESFISLFKNCNYYTSWIANQDAADTYYSFMRECDTLIYAHPDKSVYTYSNWYDEDLIAIFEKIVKKKTKQNCKLIILHTIGSHWYYNTHVPAQFNKFMPITKSKVVSQNTKEEMINSYDNSVLCTDYFLDAIIKKIEHDNSILIYLSDHGEVLGENGNWLHAVDNACVHKPAALVWFSSKYLSTHTSMYEALTENKNKHYRSDFLFHSILCAGEIPSKILDENLNIFYRKEPLKK